MIDKQTDGRTDRWTDKAGCTVRIPVKENLNFKGFEKKRWTHHSFLHRGPKKAVEHDSDIHFDLT